ncbi:MAG: hypothetical protein IJ412_05360 [Oscillospiraceae bacterium]|nr:hypothetical protein [Oscillospiraceae bacterium]
MAISVAGIRAENDMLCICLSAPAAAQRFTVQLRVPTVCGNPAADYTPGRVLCEHGPVCENDTLCIPRAAGEWDALFCRITVLDAAGTALGGVCYVDEVAPQVSRNHEPIDRRVLKSIGPSSRVHDLGCIVSDLEALGASQAISGYSQPASMVSTGEDAIEHRFAGRSFFFKRSYVETIDSYMRQLAEKGIRSVVRCHNDPFYYGKAADEAILDIIVHPDYDYDSTSTYISAFNLRTEEGVLHYLAWHDFFLARYAGTAGGRAFAMELGNEVNSGYIWNNAGEMDVNGAMLEYTQAMRLAWLVSKQYAEHFRVCASFDYHFTACHIEDPPLRYYSMKSCLAAIAAHCRAEGDFPWGVATHPYPEYLTFPDFWNDRRPRWAMDTPIVNFKNFEVLPAYLARPELLYRGEERHIILTEEGLNTRADCPYTGEQSKYAYVLAYLKLRKLPTVDIFQYYPYMDNPWEFGLALGLRRFGRYTENMDQVAGEPKPVWDAILAMDSPAEEAMVAEARAYIGEQLFDYTLDPPPIAPEPEIPADGGISLAESGINNARGRAAAARRAAAAAANAAAKAEVNFST